MKILVTGASGFMGSWLCDELVDKGHEVLGVDDLSGGSLRNLDTVMKKRKFKFIRGDLQDMRICEICTKDIDVIFHLAAYASEGQSIFSPSLINDINIRPMNNLLIQAVNKGVKRFIFTSSMAVYGNQEPPFDETMPRKSADPYGAGKAYCEEMLEIFHDIYGIDYIILRPHNVFGERQNTADPFRNVIGIWMNMMMQGKRPYIYGDGSQTRAFSYVRNTMAAIANCVDCEPNQIINVGGETERTLLDVYEIVSIAMGTNLEPIYMPDRPGEVKHAYCTNKKAREVLNYRDNWSFDAGIMKMAEWAKQIGPQRASYRLPLEIEKYAPKVWRDKLI